MDWTRLERSGVDLIIFDVQVTKDEGIRPTTMEGLAKLRAAFKEGGSTTAGLLHHALMLLSVTHAELHHRVRHAWLCYPPSAHHVMSHDEVICVS